MLLIVKYLTAITAFCLFQIWAYKRYVPEQQDVYVAANLCLMFITFLITRSQVEENVRQ